MTLAQALDLRVKDHVVHVATAVSRRPIPITDVWVNEKRTIVLIRCASIRSSIEWLDATGYELPPEGLVYDYKYNEWTTAAEKKRRKTEGRAA